MEAAQPHDSDRSAERAALNEARFRESNEEIDRRRRELEVDGARFPLLCECARETCTEIIRVRVEDYRSAREDPKRFIVIREHTDGSAIVGREDDYAVIEKGGREGEFLEELDS